MYSILQYSNNRTINFRQHSSQKGTILAKRATRKTTGLQGQHCRKQERNTSGHGKATKKRYLEIKLICKDFALPISFLEIF